MLIHESIEIKRFPCIISLIGGGGKSTTMYRLAEELSQQGKKVLITTTTHIALPKIHEVEQFIIEPQYDDAIEKLQNHFKSHNIIGWASMKMDNSKVKGIPKSWIKKITEENIANVVIVEADGAKGKPFKAPALHEPVLPQETDIIIIVIGIDALDKPIVAQYVHRPEKILSIIGKGEEDGEVQLTKEYISKVIFHPQGLFKDIHKKHQIVLLINKVEKEEEKKAIDLAHTILREERSRNVKVLIGRVQDAHNPILQRMEREEL